MSTLSVISTGGSGNLPTTNELKVDMTAKRMSSFGALAPLTKILATKAATGASNFRIDAIEEHAMPTTVICGTTESTASTSIVVQAYGTSLVQSTVLYNPRTNDFRTVDSTPTTNTVTVTISACGSTSTAWQSGDVIHVLPPQLAENDALSTFRATSVADTNIYNYVQIIKLQFAITRLQDKMASHFGGPGEKRAQLKRQKYREFREKEEKLLYFGGRSTSGTAPASVRSQGGLNHFLRDGTLYKNFNGTLTETGLDSYLGDYKDQNPDVSTVDMLSAPNVIRIINQFGKDKIRISPQSKEYGLNLNQYIGPGLMVNLIPAPLLTDGTTRGWGWLLDWSRIQLRDIDPPTYYPDALTVGQSEVIVDTYRSATSMLCCNEERHSMFVGALN